MSFVCTYPVDVRYKIFTGKTNTPDKIKYFKENEKEVVLMCKAVIQVVNIFE